MSPGADSSGADGPSSHNHIRPWITAWTADWIVPGSPEAPRVNTGVVALEYASEGRIVRTGAAYTNRYISVLTITDGKVTRWRDYLDPVAVFDALGWP